MSESVPNPLTRADLSKHADWPKTLEWVEKQGLDSLRARFTTAELISKEAQTTLTVLLAAVGGSAAYGSKIFEPQVSSVALAAAVVCVYFVILSVVLVVRCMMFQSYPALYQDPANLMHPSNALDEIREAELFNLQDRIKEATAINKERAAKLNWVRIAAALSPVLFVFATLVAPSTVAPTKPQSASLTCSVSTPASSGRLAFNCELKKLP